MRSKPELATPLGGARRSSGPRATVVTALMTPRVFAWACAKGLFDNVLSDYLWARAVLLTSPTVASVGLSMQIPMAAFVEAAMGRARWADSGASALGMLGGCGLVLAGFLRVVYK